MSTLITYWQSEASRILQAQAEARARLATLRQEGAVTRQALRTAQDQALTAAAEQERLRAALARVTMPADATPLLNDLSAARVAQAQALSEAVATFRLGEHGHVARLVQERVTRIASAASPRAVSEPRPY